MEEIWTSDVGGNLFLNDERVAVFESAYTAEMIALKMNENPTHPFAEFLKSDTTPADYVEIDLDELP